MSFLFTPLFVKKWGWGKRGALHSYLTVQSSQSQY